MNRSIYFRFSLSFLLIFAMLSPLVVFAGESDVEGKKHFKEGLKYESTEQWDKAAEEFALAVSNKPKNPEYRLHLWRSLFNASQMYMKKGTIAANEKDYEAGYVAFRRAYSFDPTNELAKSEMERMVRLQKDLSDPANPDKKNDNGKVKLVSTSFVPQNTQIAKLPPKLEKWRDVSFPAGVDLQYIIKDLAKDLDLNVLFDTESFRSTGRKTNIDIKNVTAAQALDYIFLQEGLFFQKVGPHTILVATQNQRVKFQQLVLRTFYLANASPKDIATVISTAIPAQPGRSQTIVLQDSATNSVTIRDTSENIRLIGKLIQSLDKDRAEVVMDVAIYEVNKSDLLQLGNQIGTSSGPNSLLNLGGVGVPLYTAGPTDPLLKALPFLGTFKTAFAIGLPNSQIAALQQKSDTKLIASTQIHAFNNEDSSAVIGQRVPVQSAQFVGVGNTTPGSNGAVQNVINYEQVGLTLKFKPLVFPNQDVQVTMDIESKDVAGAQTLTPTFTERTIKGTARIQNNKTLLLASVAQGTETNGRSGLPLLGLIPIFGRLFTAPTKDNRQVDIVIAVTPRVIRAPAILPEDEVERETGSLGVPTGSSLEAMIIADEQQELLAAARRTPNTVEVQLPDRQADVPVYVKADSAANADNGVKVDAQVTGGNTTTANNSTEPNASMLKPIDNSVKTLQLNQTADTSKGIDIANEIRNNAANPSVVSDPSEAPSTEISIGSELKTMKTGEKAVIPVLVKGTAAFHSAVLGLKFDQKKVAVRLVSLGDVFGQIMVNKQVTPFLNQNGKMFISLSADDARPANPTGVLAYIEIEALADSTPEIAFERDMLNFLTTDGKNFVVKFDK